MKSITTLLSLTITIGTTSGFVVPSALEPLAIGMEPAAVEMGLVATLSAVAGALSQQPRIQELEREVVVMQKALNETKSELVSKVQAFEDKLFDMDQEYEAQTARFKKRYDTRMKKDLEAFQEKLKIDYQYKLEVNLDRQKSDLLLKQLEKESTRTDQEGKLTEMRLQLENFTELNGKLEEALLQADAEMERMRKETERKSGFMRLFG